MEFEDIIRRRFATRKFSSQKVEKEKVDKILEAGRLAPTAKNKQPIKIYVVESDKGLESIDKASRCRYGAPLVLVVCGNKNEAFQKGEHNTYEMDSCIVGTHMLLEATNLNVDNIWVELFDENILREEFNIPSEIIPVCILPMGYKDIDCPVNPMHSIRKDINDLVEYR